MYSKRNTRVFFMLFIPICILFVMSMGACDSKKVKKQPLGLNTSQFITLQPNKLQELGVNIIDGKVLYNNKIYNVGTLNLVIKGVEYSAGSAKTPITHHNFYPRYITTLDTIQRYAYNLQGKGANTVEEAQKWATFDKLVPIIVEQQQDGQKFGETLVFWFTRTDSLLMILNK